jgi:uncharacterized protein (DUF924 family)
MSNVELCDALLAFWFGDAADDAAVARGQSRLWWSKKPEADRLIAERFADALLLAARGDLRDWPDTPHGRLARVILLDQLPRNIYRGRLEAFAWDVLARQQAEAALAGGDEAALRPIERVFLYMPFMHAEDLALQGLAVEHFAGLCAQVPEPSQAVFQDFLKYAVKHRDIIRRFGRFPHRNAILGRSSTAEEIAFLREPGSSF